MTETKLIKISRIEPNRGQIEGLPKNPRIIRDAKFEKLKQSIEEFPEMLKLREIVVFPHGKKFVAIGGNMRLAACKELGYADVPARVLPAAFPIEKLREFALKDNAAYGDWDFNALAAAEWGALPLADWGILNLGEHEKVESLNTTTEWVGMPDFEPGENSFKIVINFETEKEREEFAAQHELKFLVKQAKAWSTWYPFREREDLKSLKYEPK